MDELLTVSAASQYLGVSRDKVSRLIKSGQLTAVDDVLDSRQKLIPRSQLDALKPSGRVVKVLNTEPFPDMPLSELLASVGRAQTELASGHYNTDEDIDQELEEVF